MGVIKQYLTTGLAVVIFAVAGFWAQPSLAFTADLVSITPDATDMTDQLQGGGAPAGVALFGWLGTVDTDYTAVFSVDESPAMIVSPGADLSTDNAWSYDADAGTVTVNFTLKGLIGSDEFPIPDGMGMTIVALVPSSDDGSGPPVEMTGGWFATNLQSWEIVPPSPENVAFGFNLTGPSGETGYFHMFMPTSLIDLMGQMRGENLTVDDLAVFNGDYQSSMSVTEVTGGAYIDINVTFNDTSTTVSATSDVTKSITAAPRLALSLAAKKTSITSGSKAKLYGWINKNKANKTVEIWSKASGAKKFTKLTSVKTDDTGYFYSNQKLKKTTKFKAIYRSNTTDKITVNVD